MPFYVSQNQLLPDYLGSFGRGIELSNVLRQRQLAEKELGRQEQIRGMAPGILAGDPNVLARATAVDPFATQRLQTGQLGIQQAQQRVQAGRQQMQLEDEARLALNISRAPEEMRPQLWQEARQELISKGYETEESVPEEWTPELSSRMQSMISGAIPVREQIITPKEEREFALREKGLAQQMNIAERRLAIAEKDFNLKAKELEQKLKTGGLEPKEVFDQTTKLRSEYIKLSGDFIKQRDAYGRVQASAKDPSPAGDLALIFNYMKVLDPGSTVREGEFANAENSGSVPARIFAQYNKVLKGERLTPKMRSDFVNRSGYLFEQAEVQQDQTRNRYVGLARLSGLPEERVAIDLGYAEKPETEAPTPEYTEGQTATNPQTGQRLIYRNGQWQPI